MARKSQQDPTKFFSVVGAPYVREQHGHHHYVRERRTHRHRPPTLKIGLASAFAAFCGSALGVSLFANHGAAKLAEVAVNAVK